MPAVYLRRLPDLRPQDIVLRDPTVGPILASGTYSSSSQSRQRATDLVLWAGRVRPQDVTLRFFFLAPRIHARGAGTCTAVSSSTGRARVRLRVKGTAVSTSTSSGSARVRVRITGTSVSISSATGAATVIPGPPPHPPIPFVEGRFAPSIDGPGGHQKRGQHYKPPADVKPFPLEGQRQKVSEFKPKRMGFKARRTKPPFRPMS